MRNAMIAAVILLVLSGCYCRRCWGQEKEVAAEVILTSTAVAEWKSVVYDWVNRVDQNEQFSAICNLFLIHAYGLPKIPQGAETVTVPAATGQRLDGMKKGLRAMIGRAIIEQAKTIDDNQAAIAAAVETATDSIKDETARREFLERAKRLQK